jgi:two-component system, chemotaxis family, protein-glutamate methylesterase/glutaminase
LCPAEVLGGNCIACCSGLLSDSSIESGPRTLPNATKVRVLIVDDSVVIRKILSDTLSASTDPAIEVVGSAHDGKIALAKIPLCHPDLITLDIEMPVMNGLETLVEIRKLYPKLPVIMYSTLTERGAAATLDALSLGASDYATKPSNTGSPAAAIDSVREELIPKIKALCTVERPLAASPRPRPTVADAHPRRSRRIDIVAIGTSTGGPNALAEVFPAIPKDFPVPIVTVQHMPPIFTRLLAERLCNHSQISVEEAHGGERLSAAHAWIAPGNFHMTVMRDKMDAVLVINQDPPEHSCRPAVDVLFRSVAASYGSGTLAVVMTGMGSDGVEGAKRIREAGGEVIVQDEASSVVWGMPGLTYASGLADAVYPLEQIGQEIVRRVLQSRTSVLALQPGSYAV